MSKRTAVSGGLAALALSTLMPSLDTSIANVALPTLSHEFGASFSLVRWTVLAYLLAVTAALGAAGHLGDVFGRRRTLAAGLVLFTGASMACGLAPNLTVLIAARAAQGIGAAAMMALSTALAGDLTGPRTGRAVGTLGTMSAIGTTLGAPVGGAMIAWLGWRSVFLINLPIGIAALALVLRTLPSSSASGPIDSARAIDGAADERMSLGSACLRRSLAMSAAISAVIMTTLVVGPFYLSRELQLEPARVGLVMAVGPMIAALAGVPSGRLVERIGASRATTAGLIVIASGCFALSALPSSVGLAGYLAPIALVTSGYALFQTANVTGVMTRIRSAHRGAAAGWLSLSRYAGLSAGTWLMGAVYALASSVTGDAAAGMRATFAVGVTLVGAALALSTTTTTTTHNQ